MGFADEVLEAVRRELIKYPSERQLTLACGLFPGTITRWLKRDRSPNIDDVGRVFDTQRTWYRFRRSIEDMDATPRPDAKAQEAEIEHLKRKIYGLEQRIQAYETALRIAAGREAPPSTEWNAQKKSAEK